MLFKTNNVVSYPSVTFQAYYRHKHYHILLEKCKEVLQRMQNLLTFFQQKILANLILHVCAPDDLTNPPIITLLS